MGQVVKLNSADNTYTVVKQVDTMVDKAMTGITSLFGAADEAVSSDIALYGQLATNVINTIATAKFTRKRVEDDKDAIGGIFF